MKKIQTALVIFFVLIIGVVSEGFAQRQISGTVLSSNGEPVKFATVQVLGTSRGTSADENGKFKINAKYGEQIKISSIGYEPSTIKVGKSDNIVVTLSVSGDKLGEVVVTALGISRQKKTLGYAVQEINNKALTEAADNNIVNTIMTIVQN